MFQMLDKLGSSFAQRLTAVIKTDQEVFLFHVVDGVINSAQTPNRASSHFLT